jgi:hypothetical protein
LYAPKNKYILARVNTTIGMPLNIDAARIKFPLEYNVKTYNPRNENPFEMNVKKELDAGFWSAIRIVEINSETNLRQKKKNMMADRN